jgi:hypothetical protein
MMQLMDPIELMRSVYLGDRACKSIIMDGWNRRLSFQIDVLSRIRSTSGYWNFYSAEDIIDGWLVFSEVGELCGDFRGLLPNDFIDLRVMTMEASTSQGLVFACEAVLGAVDEAANTSEVRLQFQAQRLHLEDPSKPGVRITS